jgi:hypothetical protein
MTAGILALAGGSVRNDGIHPSIELRLATESLQPERLEIARRLTKKHLVY